MASGWHATYKKLVPGTPEEFQNVVLDRFSIIPVWYEGRGRATIYKPITMPISGDDNLLSARDGKASFLSVMEKFNIQITMNEENSSTIEHRYASSKGIAAFKVILFSFNTVFDLDTIFKALNPSGIRLIEVGIILNRETRTLHWRVFGELWVKS